MDLIVHEVKLTEELILDDLCEDDDLEELIYTIIDACPYDFQAIPTIASFKYLSFFDKISQYNGVRYFFKMYKLIDMLCFYKELITKLETSIKNNSTENISSSKAIALSCSEEELFASCQIEAIKIYKSNFLEEDSSIDDLKLAFCLNCIINEFFEEAFSSKLKKSDISREVRIRAKYDGFDIFEFI